MAPESENNLRLEIGHVLFIDLVGYSKLLIEEQKERLRQLTDIVLATAQVAESTNEKLVRLPTGDGMALVFRNSSEEPARCALEIARALKPHPEIAVRMGIHSGPVSEMTDVNGRTNIAGAGINLAQRVMDCGDAGHILLSQRVAEDLAQYRQWSLRLHDLGECEVKHGVRLHVVNLYTEEVGNPEAPEKFKKLTEQKQPASAPVTVADGTRKRIRWGVSAAVLLVSAMLVAGVLFFSHRSVRPTSVAATPVPLAPAVPTIPEKSIAVLPFENLSANQENAFFADGVQDEILTDLAKVADLKVISRTSVMNYRRATGRNLRQIGQELGVAHLLEGSVQRAANRVRVNAQLIDARTDRHLWADHYDRDLADVFAIQSEVAQKIADSLRAKISPSEKSAIAEKPTTDLQAYDLYARARAIFAWNDPKDARKSLEQQIELLKQATQRDPNFILAYCALAKSYADVANISHEPATLQLAEEAASAALRLRPDLGEARLALAYSYYIKGDFDRASDELAAAQRTLPNNSFALWIGGQIDRDQGRMEEAVAKLRRAYELDPRNGETHYHLIVTYLMMQRYRDGEDLLAQNVISDLKGSAWHDTLLAQFKFAEGDLAEAERLLAQVPLDFNPTPQPFVLRVSDALWRRDYETVARLIAAAPLSSVESMFGSQGWMEGLIARARGDNEQARSLFRASRQRTETLQGDKPKDAWYFVQLARCDAGLGQKDDALREAQQAADLASRSREYFEQQRVRRALVLVYAWTGERERALVELEAIAKILGGPSYGQLRFDPMWDALRGDPRFEKIVASLAPKDAPPK